MRGFIIPRFQTLDSIWESESTVTQQNPRGGVPVAQRSSGLVLQTAGDMAADEHVEVLTQRAGHAGSTGKAKFVWRDASSGDYYGRNTANAISYFEHVFGSATIDYLPRDVVATSSGHAFIVCERQETAANPSVVIIRRNSNGTHDTPVTIATTDTTSLNDKLFAGLCELGDGSILCAYWSHDTLSSQANINIHRSDDNGATWSRISTNALSEDIGTSASTSDYVVGRIRVRSNLGQVLLVASLVSNDTSGLRDRIGQYASTDNGATYTKITITGTSEAKGFHSLAVVNNQFVLSVVTSLDNAYVYRFSNAFLNISTVETNATLKKSISLGGSPTIATLTTNAFTAGQSSMWVDDDDVLWIVFEQLNATPFLFIVRSSDYGDSWSGMGLFTTSGGDLKDDGTWFIQASGSTLERVVGVSYGGTQLAYNNWSSISAATLEGDLGVVQLGGYSSVTLPPVTTLSGDTSRAAWTSNYLPFDKPDNVGWTKSTAGTAADQIATTGLNVTTTSGSIDYTKTITNDLLGGAIIRCHLDVISRSTNTPTIEARISNGTSRSYTIQLFIDSNTIRLYDVEAAAFLHSAITLSTSNPTLDILIAIGDGQVNAYYLEGPNGTNKKWASIFQGALSIGTSTQAFVRFGHISTSTGETDFKEFHYADDLKVGSQMSYGQQNPDEVWARGFPSRGNFTNLTGSLQISTVDGGTYEGDSWVINPSYEYPIQNVYYESSPSNQTTWRSQASASTLVPSMFLPWFVDDTAQDMTIMRNDLMGIHLENINFKSFQIKRHNGSTWSTIAAVENTAYNGAFTRDGASIRGTITTNYPYFFFNECQEWYAKMISADELTIKIRKIRTNSEGSFANVSSKQSIIYLEGIDGTEPTSGTLQIIPSRCTVLINLLGVSNDREAKAFGIQIMNQDVQEQYFKIGSLSWGEMFIAGRQYGRGRSISYSSGVEISERNNGALFTRSTGNKGRQVRISWADGVDSSRLYDDDAAPNYWTGSTSSGSEPVATQDDVPESMIGLARYLEGAKHPLVYIPKFIKSTASADDVQVLNRYGEGVLMTLDSDLEIKNVVGDEFNGLGSGELWRVTTIRLREVR